MSNTNRWFFCRSERPNARLRLFCMPYAGSGASAFNRWPTALPDSIELYAVQLPGREIRYREPMFTDIYQAANELADEIRPFLDLPYAFFGYSMGALIAFELMRELRRRGDRLPEKLFVAARRAPQIPMICPALSDLPLDSFLDQIRECYDPPQDLWEIPELLEIIIPTLRADIKMCEAYYYQTEDPFLCPIHAFAGDLDQSSPPSAVEAWREQSLGNFQLDVIEGGHFFINKALDDILYSISSSLEGVLKED